MVWRKRDVTHHCVLEVRREPVVQSSFAAALTEFVKNRHPAVPEIELVADVAGATLAAALVVAVESWGRNGCSDDLGEVVAASLDLVRSGLAPLDGKADADAAVES